MGSAGECRGRTVLWSGSSTICVSTFCTESATDGGAGPGGAGGWNLESDISESKSASQSSPSCSCARLSAPLACRFFCKRPIGPPATELDDAAIASADALVGRGVIPKMPNDGGTSVFRAFDTFLAVMDGRRRSVPAALGEAVHQLHVKAAKYRQAHRSTFGSTPGPAAPLHRDTPCQASAP